MKKMVQRFLCAGMALAMALALAACGGEGGNSGGASFLGLWELTDYRGTTIEQGKLATALNSTIILFSDNTYVMSAANNAYYSSDGGETYNPTNYVAVEIYGSYEITSRDDELGEIAIKLNTVDRVMMDDYDTAVSVTDEEKEIMASTPLIGAELYLTSDGKMSEIVEYGDLYKIGPRY